MVSSGVGLSNDSRDVFISYSTRDYPFVKQLEEFLQQTELPALNIDATSQQRHPFRRLVDQIGMISAQKLRQVRTGFNRLRKGSAPRHPVAFQQTRRLLTWIDRRGIDTGDVIWEKIRPAIENSNNFVFIISPDSMNSWWCNRELEYARHLNKTILPIMYRKFDVVKLAAKSSGDRWTSLAHENWLVINEILYKPIDQSNLVTESAKLAEKLLEKSDAKQFQAELVRHCEEWKHNGNLFNHLLTDSQLTKVSKYRNAIRFSADQVRYIQASNEQRRRLRLLKYGIAVGLTILVTILIGIGVLFFQNRDLEFRRNVIEAFNTHVIASNHYMQHDDKTAKEKYAESLTQLNPDDQPWETFAAPVYADLGVDIRVWLNNACAVYAQLKDYEKAEKYCNDAINAFPDFPGSYAALVTIYSQQFNDESDDFVKKANDILDQFQNHTFPAEYFPHPDFQNYIVTWKRGIIAYELEDYDQARSFLASPLLLDYPLDSIYSAYELDIFYHIAMSYIEEDETEKACEYFSRYQRLILEYPPTLRLLNDLEHYKKAAQEIKHLHDCWLLPISENE